MVHHDRMRICEDCCIPMWVGRVRQKLLEGEDGDVQSPVDEETELALEPIVEEVANNQEHPDFTTGQNMSHITTVEPLPPERVGEF